MDVEPRAARRVYGHGPSRRLHSVLMLAISAWMVATVATADESAETPALARTLAVCHPHLRRASLPLPLIDVSRISDPAAVHMKLDLRVDAAGAVAWKSMMSADFGLPSEQQAVLAYAQALEFDVPSTADCWGLQMEIFGEVTEQRNRLGQWSTVVRLYPRYALDRAGAVVTRD